MQRSHLSRSESDGAVLRGQMISDYPASVEAENHPEAFFGNGVADLKFIARTGDALLHKAFRAVRGFAPDFETRFESFDPRAVLGVVLHGDARGGFPQGRYLRRAQREKHHEKHRRGKERNVYALPEAFAEFSFFKHPGNDFFHGIFRKNLRIAFAQFLYPRAENIVLFRLRADVRGFRRGKIARQIPFQFPVRNHISTSRPLSFACNARSRLRTPLTERPVSRAVSSRVMPSTKGSTAIVLEDAGSPSKSPKSTFSASYSSRSSFISAICERSSSVEAEIPRRALSRIRFRQSLVAEFQSRLEGELRSTASLRARMRMNTSCMMSSASASSFSRNRQRRSTIGA